MEKQEKVDMVDVIKARIEYFEDLVIEETAHRAKAFHNVTVLEQAANRANLAVSGERVVVKSYEALIERSEKNKAKWEHELEVARIEES